MRHPALSITGLNKRFRQAPVLEDINLEIDAGSYVGLVGRNGAGKTTLIKCLLDFIAFESGHISIFGECSSKAAARRHLAYLPEKFMPPYYLSGRDYLDYMARLYQQPYEAAAVAQMLSILDLDMSALGKPARAFSKGMAQKLGLAACLLSKRQLLILDEPMSGLDPKARAHLKRHLLELKNTGQTVFFSTHLLVDAEALCDQVAILHAARLPFIGSPSACCAAYGTEDLEQAYLKCVGEE